MSGKSISRNVILQNSGLIIICLIFFVLGIFRLNDLSIYTPDSARYLIFGNSIAHTGGLTDNTQPEPDRFVVQGPLYPILLAPIEFVFPLALTAAKIWTLLWGVLAIILFYRWILTAADRKIAIVSTLFFAFNPLMLVYSSEVLAEAPFLAFLIFAFILVERFVNEQKKDPRLFIGLILSVIAVVLLREIGVALLLAVLLLLFSRKYFTQAGVILFVTAAVLILWYSRNHWWIGASPSTLKSNYGLVLEHIVTAPDTPLANEIALRMWINLKSSFMQLGGMILYPLFLAQQFKLGLMPSDCYQMLSSFFSGYGKFLVLIVTMPLMVYGIILDLKKSRSGLLKLMFGLIYCMILMVYPVYDIRFLLIILPLLIYYCARSVQSIVSGRFLPQLFHKMNYVVLFGLIFLVPNVASIYEIMKLNTIYRKSPIAFFQIYGKKQHCPVMYTQPWSLLGEWIRGNLPDSVIIASPSKDLAIVVGERKVLEIDQGVVEHVFEILLRDNHVDYLLSPSKGQDLKIYDFLMGESKRYRFEEVYSVGNLYLYKVHSKSRESSETIPKTLFSNDTSSANYLLQKGRMELLSGNYAVAHKLFSSTLALDSTHPSILYQMIVYYSLTNDSIQAKRFYDKLYTSPQALGYTLPARLQLQAMARFRNALTENDPTGKAEGIYVAASIYWKLGYEKYAQQIMNGFFLTDTSYFTGLLWGMHYNFQLGDSTDAKKYLTALTAIDKGNPVVLAYNKIISLGDSLRIARTPLERSRIHFRIGSLYKDIELNEEAIDEAERSLSFDQNNTGALMLMAQIFERKSNLRMARRIYNEALSIEPMNAELRSRIKSINESPAGK